MDVTFFNQSYAPSVSVLYLRKAEIRQVRHLWRLTKEQAEKLVRYCWFSADAIEKGDAPQAIVSIDGQPFMITLDPAAWGSDFVLWLMDSPHVILR